MIFRPESDIDIYGFGHDIWITWDLTVGKYKLAVSILR